MTRRDLVFRVFVSSTFSDLVEERNALQERTFPRLRAYCQQKGARFQAIDLRWGVSEVASRDQQTMNICLLELKRCQRLSPRPNFIVVLGDRYGWRPLPSQIEAKECESLLAVMDPEQQAAVAQWYRRDENAVPPEYVLQPRTDEFENQRRWSEAEARLHDLLLRTAQRTLPLNSEALNKYQDSATHQEIRHGVFSAEHPQDHVFAYFRTIQGLPEDGRANVYRDISNGLPDTDSDARLNALKNEIRKLLPQDHVHQFPAQWRNVEGDAPSGPLISYEHLQTLCDRMESDLRKVIDHELATFQQTSPLDREIKAHDEFGSERVKHFVGQTDRLQRIAAYLTNTDSHPLVIHGAAGSGKTSLMAKAILACSHQKSASQKVFRYCGISPASSDLRSLLESLCRQIARVYGDTRAVPMELQELIDDFSKRLALATGEQPLVVFLDALDQLSLPETMTTLAWLPHDLLPHVKLVVSLVESDQEDGACLDAVRERVPMDNVLRLTSLTQKHGEQILDLWLNEVQRTLQPAQRQEVMRHFAVSGLPLYLKLAFEEARRWKSHEGLPREATNQHGLTDTVEGMVLALLRRFEEERNHGRLVTRRALGSLAAARHGLAEDELLEILWSDIGVRRDFRRRSPRSPSVAHLPVAVWSRLYSDLLPYLSTRQADGVPVLMFYHRQMRRVVAQQYLDGADNLCTHRCLARYFRRMGDPSKTDAWVGGSLRSLRELPYHLLEGRRTRALFALARDEGFLTIQRDTFHHEPDLPLRTLRDALQGAANINDAARMVEFSLAHAKRLGQAVQESPLNALRAGNIERAWNVADMQGLERCVFWHLLLAWELNETGRHDNAKATLRRLREKELSVTDRWKYGVGAILAHVSEIDPESFSILQKRLLDDSERRELCDTLVTRRRLSAAAVAAESIHDLAGHIEALTGIAVAHARTGDTSGARTMFAEVLTMVPMIKAEPDRAKALGEIAVAMGQAGDQDGRRTVGGNAIVAALGILDEYSRDDALGAIARKQARTGDILGALATSEHIKNGRFVSVAGLEIAETQAQGGDLAAARNTAKRIPDGIEHAVALATIAALEARNGDHKGATATFADAICSVRRIKGIYSQDKDTRGLALREIANRQAQVGDVPGAMETVSNIEVKDIREWTLHDMAIAQAKNGDSIGSTATALIIGSEFARTNTFREIAVEQARRGDVAASLATAGRQTTDRGRTLHDVAVVLAENGDCAEARTILAMTLPETDQIEDSGSLTRALCSIASAQAKSGDDAGSKMTFDAAVSAAAKAPSTYLVAKLLQHIVLAQCRVGHFAGALATSDKIEPGHDWVRIKALCSIVTIQAENGDDTGSRTTLEMTLTTAQAMKNKRSQATALKRIALTQRGIGDGEGLRKTLAIAMATVLGIADHSDRAFNLCDIAEVEAEAENKEEAQGILVTARVTADKIRDPHIQARTLSHVAETQAQTGDFTGALVTARGIHHPFWETEALKTILVERARFQASTGDFAGALATVDKVEKEPDRSEALRDIAVGQARAGDLPSAMALVQRIQYDFQARVALGDIVVTQVKAGDFTGAQATASRIEAEPSRSAALCDIAVGQARAGDLPSAMATIRQIQHGYARGQAFAEIAMAHIRTKTEGLQPVLSAAMASARGIEDTEATRMIAEAARNEHLESRSLEIAIPTSRGYFLTDIATALAERGYKIYFKSLLVPCAYRLDSAYRMSGLLTKLYPEQVAAIAEVARGVSGGGRTAT